MKNRYERIKIGVKCQFEFEIVRSVVGSATN